MPAGLRVGTKRAALPPNLIRIAPDANWAENACQATVDPRYCSGENQGGGPFTKLTVRRSVDRICARMFE